MRTLLLIPCLGALLAGAATPPRPGNWWQRAFDEARGWVASAREARPDRAWGVSILEPDGSRTPAPDAVALPARLVVLIHGLDEPGGVWDELITELRAAGLATAVLDYPNDQAIRESTLLALDSLRGLRARGVTTVDLVCHSMGGLIARDLLALESGYAGAERGHDDLPDVDRLIMIGTPHQGSAWARARVAGEVREQVARWIEREDWRELLGFRVDGQGEAAADLLPGSAFLAALNLHPLPEGVRATAIVGDLTPLGVADGTWASELPDRLASGLGLNAGALAGVASEVGDGVVPVSSARDCPGVDRVVFVRASHRGMLRSMAAERAYWSLVGEAPPASPPALAEVLRLLLE